MAEPRYPGRPGLPGAVAALVADGRIRRDHRILDVGCGTGTDALLLARWGFRKVEGVDPDAGAVAIARRRATRLGVSKRLRFQQASAETLDETFPPGSFDVVLHTLVANNLGRGKERHFRGLARILRPGGLLVLHERVLAREENARPDRVPPLAALRRHFKVGPGVATHLAEWTGRDGDPGHARVILWLGRPR